jgi:hypothetical protein
MHERLAASEGAPRRFRRSASPLQLPHPHSHPDSAQRNKAGAGARRVEKRHNTPLQRSPCRQLFSPAVAVRRGTISYIKRAAQRPTGGGESDHTNRAHSGPELRPCGRRYALRDGDPRSAIRQWNGRGAPKFFFETDVYLADGH